MDQNQQPDPADLLARLDALGQSLAKTRKDAIDGRAASGIEQIWVEDEEHYEGIDDLNRGKVTTEWQQKPPGQAFPRTPDYTSIVFPNITRPYVDAAASKVGDILLPTDDRPWSLEATPIPELIDKAKGLLPPEAVQGLKQAGAKPEGIQNVANTEAQQAQAIIEQAKATAKKAEQRIEDWMVEGQWHAEMRKVIDDVTKVGSGVLKGPFPVTKRSQAFKGGALIVQDETKPVSKRVNYWNFFPDPSCGDSIHDGAYTWERDFITAKQLRDLKRDEEYVGSQIDKCLAEGPMKATDARKTADGRTLEDKDLFEIWYFHGFASAEDLTAAGCECSGESVAIPAMFVMVNERVIKGALNPLDSGDYPYDVMPWSRRKNMPWGAGVGRHIRTPQQIVVAGTRTLLTNVARAAGPIFVIMQEALTPLDGNNDITPWKQFALAPGSDIDDAHKALAMIAIPSMQKELDAVIQYGMKLAEDETGLPLLLQGQQGGAPETLGGQQLADRNASGTLRRIARQFDDCITEPHVTRYHEWLLLHGEDDEKGEFIIDAKGSVALVDRDMEKQEISKILEYSANPIYELSPARSMEQWLRINKRDPKDYQLTDEEKQAAQQKQQPQDPRIQVAQLNAAAEAKLETQRQQFEADQQERDRKNKVMIEMIHERMQSAELTAAERETLNKIKAQLAVSTMDLTQEKDLALASHKVDLHKNRTKVPPQIMKPPVEPAGRAPNGKAFQR